jgi:hypothetical protein
VTLMVQHVAVVALLQICLERKVADSTKVAVIFYLLICSLFKDFFINGDYIASKERVISE